MSRALDLEIDETKKQLSEQEGKLKIQQEAMAKLLERNSANDRALAELRTEIEALNSKSKTIATETAELVSGGSQAALVDNGDAARADVYTVASDETIAVFYNLFLKAPDDLHRVSGIIKEQFGNLISGVHRKVFVTSIGHPVPDLQNYTNVSEVILLNYTREGSERMTLHNLYNYCRRNPSSKAVYIHSKGSYHSTRANENLRRVLTYSALSN